MTKKEKDPTLDIWPMTLEGCVVRMADTISYIGRDIEDAIRLGQVQREEIPLVCQRVLGTTNGTIVYNLVEDLVSNSLNHPHLCFSEEVGYALRELKEFNRERIYQNETIWKQTPKIKLMFQLLFQKYFQDLESDKESSHIYKEFLDGMSEEYKNETPVAGMVRDFIAGMTDEFFLSQCHTHLVPQVNTIR